MTYATFLHNTGAAPRVVQELLRHSDPKLTNQTYTDAAKLPIFQTAAKIQLTGKVTEKVTDVSVPEGQKPSQAVTNDNSEDASQHPAQEGDSHSEAWSDTTCQNEKEIAGAGFESGGVTPQPVVTSTHLNPKKEQVTQKLIQTQVAASPELSRIVEVWHSLPQHIKTAILTLVG